MPSHETTESTSKKDVRRNHALIGAVLGLIAPFIVRLALSFGVKTTSVSLVDIGIGCIVGALVGFFFGKRILGYDPNASIPQARNLGRIGWSACLIVVSLSLLSGLAIIRAGVSDTWTAWSSTSWPTAVGVINVSKVKAVSSTIDINVEGANAPEKHVTKVVDDYFPIVEYAYEAAGKQWKGDKIYTTVISSSSSVKAKEIADRFPVGSEVKVYYDAGDPSQAVLVPGLHAGGLSGLILGTIWSLASIAIGWLLLFSNMNRSGSC